LTSAVEDLATDGGCVASSVRGLGAWMGGDGMMLVGWLGRGL